MELGGKRAIVTGATKGIGLAIAKRLAGQGVQLVLASRSQEEADQVARGLAREAAVKVVGRACDVSDWEQARDLVDFCGRELGGLEILINNAGIGIFKNVEEMSVPEWRQTLATNLDGVFYCCHFGLPLLKKSGGFIINISSLAGKNPFPKGAAYNASKFALNGFSEALMQEVRHDGVQVAYIMPGSVDTWFIGTPPVGEESWKLAADDVAEVVEQTLRRHPRCLTSRIEMRPSRPPAK